MKIKEAIAQVADLAPDVKDTGSYILWLSRLDWQVKKEILDNYTDEVEYNGYTSETSTDTVLLVPPPYDEMYVRYLEAQLYRRLKETVNYNNAIVEFNAIYKRFEAQYNRDHTPKKPHRFSFYGGV